MSGIFGTTSNQTVDEPVQILQPGSTVATLFGFNGNVSSGNLNYQNDAFLNVIASLLTGGKKKLIRWPGGISSNVWDWQNGCRETQPKGNRNNLDDLKAVVSKTNCDVVFTVNMITRTVEDQIEMLQTAQAKGIPIKYVEMGNEMSNADSDGLAKFKNGTNYAKECLIWQTAIKKVFPDVQIALWGENKIDLPTWVIDILKVLKPDAFVTHIYPDALNFIDSKGIVDTSKLSKMIDRAIAKSGLVGLNIPIWVTETNVSPYSLNDLAPGQWQTVVEFMGKYYPSKKISMVLFHNIVGELGAIADDLSLTQLGKGFKNI